ncbi:MAG: tripartite tricarboxylate transporter TctB family protein [Betaproteobacteria bacterium]|nr:tripartite tricarboxylate transporter TctB family protein [Betaproteobacteria bacterium]MDH5579247.1 tripartite tricarboxylate transporter TctB family protein [Betaproteobacteria bacterium]
MRAGFLAGILLLAGGYTWIAFAELALLSSAGRLGPGFFPRIVGGALVVLCAWSLATELRQRDRERLSRFWRATAVLALLSGVFVAALDVLGGLLSMIAYMAAALAYLNRRRTLQNALLAVLLPLAIYLLFRVWLNAAVPRGLLPF